VTRPDRSAMHRSFHRPGAARRALALALACLAALAPACARKGRKPVYPVTGRVVDAKGQGAAGALVTFHPQGDPDPNKPVATAEADGAFALTTYVKGDGAPAGDYVVTVVWPTPRKTPFEPEGGDQLKGALADPKTSKIRFTVQAGASNEVPTIQLP